MISLSFSDDQVIERWTTLYKQPLVIQRYLKGDELGDADKIKVRQYVKNWRGRLFQISWFMSCLNEHISRMANTPFLCILHPRH